MMRLSSEIPVCVCVCVSATSQASVRNSYCNIFNDEDYKPRLLTCSQEVIKGALLQQRLEGEEAVEETPASVRSEFLSGSDGSTN